MGTYMAGKDREDNETEPDHAGAVHLGVNAVHLGEEGESMRMEQNP